MYKYIIYIHDIYGEYVPFVSVHTVIESTSTFVIDGSYSSRIMAMVSYIDGM